MAFLGEEVGEESWEDGAGDGEDVFGEVVAVEDELEGLGGEVWFFGAVAYFPHESVEAVAGFFGGFGVALRAFGLQLRGDFFTQHGEAEVGSLFG